MIINLLYKLGKNLYINGKTHLACNWIKIQKVILISYEGSFLGVEELDKECKIWNPQMYAKGRFSDGKVLMHLLFVKFKHLANQKTREEYVHNIDWLVSTLIDWRIEAIYRFCHEYHGLEYVVSNISGTDEKVKFAYAIVDEDGNRHELWEEEDLKDKIDRMFVEMVTDETEGNRRCDITGMPTKEYIKVSSRFENGEASGTRLTTTQCYTDYYLGKGQQDNNICNMGLETELYFNAGMNSLMRFPRLLNYNRWCYLGDAGGMCFLPVHMQMKYWEGIYGIEVKDREGWMKLKECIFSRIKEQPLMFLEVGSPNKGRVSTYHALEFSKVESEKIIENLMWWMELISFEEQKLTKRFHISSILKVTEGEEKDISKEISIYLQHAVNCDYSAIVRQFWIPWMTKEDAPFYTIVEKMGQVIRRFEGVKEVDDNKDYLAGKLFGYACLFEKKYSKHMGNISTEYIRNRFVQFLVNPYGVWMEVRRRLEYYEACMRVQGIEPYAIIGSLEQHLLVEYDFTKNKSLSDLAILGFDSVVNKKYYERKDAEDGEKL